MAEKRADRTWAVGLIIAGGLWLALSGTCTWNYYRSNTGSWQSLAVIGLWIMLWSVLPIGLGLRALLPSRIVDWGLCLIGAVWVVGWTIAWFMGVLGDSGANGTDFLVIALMLLVFLAPGLVTVVVGWSGLKPKP
jgi:hypothetical protein